MRAIMPIKVFVVHTELYWRFVRNREGGP